MKANIVRIAVQGWKVGEVGMKWIDVSDKLPVASQMVLVSYPAYVDDAGNEYVAGVGIGYLITTATDKIWCRSDGTAFGELGFAPIEPVAWMPLPMPFFVRHDFELQEGQ